MTSLVPHYDVQSMCSPPQPRLEMGKPREGRSLAGQGLTMISRRQTNTPIADSISMGGGLLGPIVYMYVGQGPCCSSGPVVYFARSF